jgi:hypothetical protein
MGFAAVKWLSWSDFQGESDEFLSLIRKSTFKIQKFKQFIICELFCVCMWSQSQSMLFQSTVIGLIVLVLTFSSKGKE